jgi:hypothetical protein
VISLGSFSASGFAFADTMHWPIVLLPNQTATLPILTTIDTSTHAPQNAATLTLTSNAGTPLAPIALARAISYPGRFGLSVAVPVDSVPVSASVPLYVLRSGTIPGTVDEVDFHLIYNDDLFSFVKPMEADVQSVSATVLTDGRTDRAFAMKPATDRDTIAHMQFTSYLAKDHHSDFIIAGQQFLSGGETSPACIATMDTMASIPGVTLITACGDSALTAALDGQPLTIASLTPNPAGSAVEVTLEGNGSTEAAIHASLRDMLGREVWQSNVTGAFTIDVSALPSGVYFLEVRGQGSTYGAGRATREFMKE